MSPTVYRKPGLSMAQMANEPLTRSVEDYLKAISRLSTGGQPATTNQIAELLELSAPSVSGMIRVIDGLSMEQSGSFLDYRGQTIPW